MLPLRRHPPGTRCRLRRRRLPVELATIDAYLDDEWFIAPWRPLFSRRLGRPLVPVPTLLRLLYLKHRYRPGDDGYRRSLGRYGRVVQTPATVTGASAMQYR